jgi:1-deoxy-D-xylulose-5-phosphate reductoisomerase
VNDNGNTRGIAILGSTGSIGTQALDVIREQSERLHVEVLSAHSNAKLLIKQALEFRPNAVVIGKGELFQEVNSTLFDEGIKVYAGPEALEQVVEMEGVAMVLTALVGAAGLRPTLRAIAAKKEHCARK